MLKHLLFLGLLTLGTWATSLEFFDPGSKSTLTLEANTDNNQNGGFGQSALRFSLNDKPFSTLGSAGCGEYGIPYAVGGDSNEWKCSGPDGFWEFDLFSKLCTDGADTLKITKGLENELEWNCEAQKYQAPDCASGQLLRKTATGWSCSADWDTWKDVKASGCTVGNYLEYNATTDTWSCESGTVLTDTDLAKQLITASCPDRSVLSYQDGAWGCKIEDGNIYSMWHGDSACQSTSGPILKKVAQSSTYFLDNFTCSTDVNTGSRTTWTNGSECTSGTYLTGFPKWDAGNSKWVCQASYFDDLPLLGGTQAKRDAFEEVNKRDSGFTFNLFNVIRLEGGYADYSRPLKTVQELKDRWRWAGYSKLPPTVGHGVVVGFQISFLPGVAPIGQGACDIVTTSGIGGCRVTLALAYEKGILKHPNGDNVEITLHFSKSVADDKIHPITARLTPPVNLHSSQLADFEGVAKWHRLYVVPSFTTPENRGFPQGLYLSAEIYYTLRSPALD